MDLVQHFLEETYEEEELVLHTAVMKSGHVRELERRLQTGNPMALAKFYEELPKALDTESLEETSTELENTNRDKLSEDDYELINFFSEEARKGSSKNFMKISGVLVNLLHLVRELEAEKNTIPRNVEVSGLLWVYLNLYELILDTMTQGLTRYFESKGIRENRITEMRDLLADGKHLTAGSVQHELIAINQLSQDNESILSAKKSRFLRNKLGHANIFYDDASNEFVLTSGERYTFDEFYEEYELLYQFIVEWAYRLNGAETDVHNTVEDILTNVSQQVHRDFIQIERGGHRGKFSEHIQNIKTGKTDSNSDDSDYH